MLTDVSCVIILTSMLSLKDIISDVGSECTNFVMRIVEDVVRVSEYFQQHPDARGVVKDSEMNNTSTSGRSEQEETGTHEAAPERTEMITTTSQQEETETQEAAPERPQMIKNTSADFKNQSAPPPRRQPTRLVSPKRNLPCGELLGNRYQYLNICVPLYNASLSGDWESAKYILDKNQELGLEGYGITENYDTALHIAASAKRSKSIATFVQNLVSRMTNEQLEHKNENGNTALCLAAAAGNVETVTTMLERNPTLTDIPGSNGMMPLYMASLFGKGKMVSYLYDKSIQMTGDCWTQMNRSWVLQKCVEADLYEPALKIVSRWPELAKSGVILGVLARKANAFRVIKPHLIQRIIRPILAVFRVNVGPAENPSDAMKLLKIIWAEIMKLPKDEISAIIRGPRDHPTTKIVGKRNEDVEQLLGTISENVSKMPVRLHNLWRGEGAEEVERGVKQKFSSRILFVAVEMGNTEFVVELIRQYPDLIWKTNDDEQTIFHVAIQHRHEGIYNLLQEIGSMKDMITPMKDRKGNNMLHLVGKRAMKNQQKNDSGVGLQMQRELLWYKEIESVLPPSYRERKNNNSQTPHELFMEEHKDLLSANEKWMKDTANQCLVVAALIASIAFAAAFGVLGGYDQNNGLPLFLHNKSFIVLAISDAISLMFSSLSILIFVSIFISRYGELDFLDSLPRKLMTGLATLFFSIIAMLIGFSVSFFIIFPEKFIGVPVIIAMLISIPIIFYVRLQYNLLGDVYHAIFGFNLLFRPKSPRLYYQNPRH